MVNRTNGLGHDFSATMKRREDELTITIHFYGNRHPLVLHDDPITIQRSIEHYRQSEYVRMIDCEEAEAEIVRRALTEE